MSSSAFSEDIKRQAAVFDHIGAQYETVFGSNPAQAAAVEWLIQRLPPGARVLDVGAGTGIPTARLLTQAGMQVVGVDVSQEMVRTAQQNVPQATFHLMDMADIRLDSAPFHAITAFFSLLMLRKSAIESTLQRLIGLLVPEGYLVISLVEGDFDYAPIPFLDQTVHVSAYPKAAFEHEVLEQLPATLLDVQTVRFTPQPDAQPETQLFYFCQHTAR